MDFVEHNSLLQEHKSVGYTQQVDDSRYASQ